MKDICMGVLNNTRKSGLVYNEYLPLRGRSSLFPVPRCVSLLLCAKDGGTVKVGPPSLPKSPQDALCFACVWSFAPLTHVSLEELLEDVAQCFCPFGPG